MTVLEKDSGSSYQDGYFDCACRYVRYVGVRLVPGPADKLSNWKVWGFIDNGEHVRKVHRMEGEG